MADAHLRPEDLKALDQARTRLYQITSSIDSIKRDMERTVPLPTW
jgi:mediator of RNA polymerase II transcription subunit 8